jgi:flagellar biosynthetic protein FliO
MGDFWTTFLYIVVMIAVIVGAYLATKFIAGKGGRAKSRHIRMIDRMALGRDKHIILVEVGGKDLLIGVTSQSINVLGDIGRETLEADHSPKESAPPAQKGFAAQMRDFFVNMKNAPDNLGKARMEAKKARDSKAYL